MARRTPVPRPVPGLPADHVVRLQALRVTRSCIVQAPAGSGKTELLIQRVLALLAGAAQPEEVVAVTFTRKAAAEMRRRIVEALTGADTPAPPEQAHRQLTWRLARAVRRQDARHGWRLTENPQRIRTLTLDALAAELARRQPLLSGLGGSLAPTEEAAPLYREAARATLGALAETGPGAPAARRLLLHLDHNHQRAEDLLVSLLARREQWLRHLPGEAAEADAAGWRDDLEAALRRLVRDALTEVGGPLEPELLAELSAVLASAAAHLKESAPGSLPGTPPDADSVAALEQARLGWQAARGFLLTRTGGWRQAFNATVGVPAPSGATGAERARRQEFKQRVQTLAARCRELGEGWREALDAVETLPYLRYPEFQWETMEALLVLLPRAVRHLRRAFSAQGAVDFPEMGRAAGDALTAAPGGGRTEPVRHLLVDEFQDTSVSQHRLVAALTADWRPGDGRTLFLVGDPMQSIYGFREAEVGLFLNARRKGLGALPLQALQLSVNFRAGANLVGWVNRAFANVLPAAERPDLGAVPYAEAAPAPDAVAGGGVRVYGRSARDDAEEAAQVVALIRATPQAQSVAVLVRARSHAGAILAALREAGIPYQAVKMDTLASRPAVADLIALTRALLHPADRVAWLAVLRAPWCGLELEHLLRLAGGQAERTVWELLAERGPALAGPAARRLARAREVLDHARAQRGRHPLRRWVEETWVRLGGPACVGTRDGEAVAAFLASLDALEGAGQPVTHEALEATLERLYAPPDAEADGRVQVMTIHQAKGLEFDTVILPGLGRPPRRSQSELLRWWERTTGSGGTDLLLAPLAEAGAEDICHRYLRQVQRLRESHETGRLLYVAATRARDTLHLLGHAKADTDGQPRPAADSLLAHLWPVVEADFETAPGDAEAAAVAGDVPSAAGAADPPLWRLPVDWALPPPPPAVGAPGSTAEPAESREPVEAALRARVSSRHVGTVVHESLQRIAEQGGPAQSPGWVERRRPYHELRLRRLGVPAGELREALDRCEAALLGALDDPHGRWLLQDHEQASSELALTAWIDGRAEHAVIDRTFVDAEGTRWIVDYKTSRHEGAGLEEFLAQQETLYRPQLEGYARVMRTRDGARPIRLGLYFPLLPAWRPLGPAPAE